MQTLITNIYITLYSTKYIKLINETIAVGDMNN